MNMNWTVDELMKPTVSTPNNKISQSLYEQWAREFIFEGLRDQRYGQSFCNRFGITDNILYYSDTVSWSDQYIQENYIK
jgi:hypothetical protein